MGHCRCCDVLLTSFETTRKIVREDNSVEYVDMCNLCFRESGIGKLVNVVERTDLSNEDIGDEWYDEQE